MPEPEQPILSSGDDDATCAYIFRARDDASRHAVTRDPAGTNLPPADHLGGWVFDRAFALGVREALPLHMAPEPVLRGLLARGYFVWSDHSNPKGTSQ